MPNLFSPLRDSILLKDSFSTLFSKRGNRKVGRGYVSFPLNQDRMIGARNANNLSSLILEIVILESDMIFSAP